MSTTDDRIKKVLDKTLSKKGMTKTNAYAIVSEKCKVPRPTVRRVARELKNDYEVKIAKLSNRYNNIKSILRKQK